MFRTVPLHPIFEQLLKKNADEITAAGALVARLAVRTLATDKVLMTIRLSPAINPTKVALTYFEVMGLQDLQD